VDLDGSEWLERVFAPALRRGAPPLSALHWQVQALQACGVLDAGQAADAKQRIEASQPVIEPPASTAPPPTNRLVRVLAPALPLADVDGVTYVVTSVELWEHSVEVFVAGVPSVETARRERAADAALEQWARQRNSDPATKPEPPMDAIRGRQLGVLVRIGDDVGTAYRMAHASMGGSGTPWRLHVASTPGVPATAKRIVVHVDDDDGRPVQRQEIPLDT